MGPACTFEFDGESSGLLGPGESRWPFINGYAFATWIYIESFADTLNTATVAAAIAAAAAARSGKSSAMSAAAAASALAGEGTNPPPTMAGLQRRRRQCPLFAEMGPVYIFKEPIGPERMSCMASRGGDIVPSFGNAAGLPWLATNAYVQSKAEESERFDVQLRFLGKSTLLHECVLWMLYGHCPMVVPCLCFL
ncbi:hypothetical protein V8G54_019036 [Vigna mungo]|uniref:Uncharacterized protein n=1 Tax=Vigna mungo TaxID=3915 RepID=A0AAQ3N9V7_VIGMU